MIWEWDDRYTEWLPPHQAQHVKANEQERLRRLIAALDNVSSKITDEQALRTNSHLFEEIEPWIGHVTRCVRVGTSNRSWQFV